MAGTHRAWDVAVVGGINSDFVVHGRELPRAGGSAEGDRFLAGVGGKGANAAVSAVRLGARAALIGRIGADGRGRRMLAAVIEQGVHAGGVTVDREAATGAAVIHVDARGRKQTLAALGANMRLNMDDVEAAAPLLRASRVLLAQFEVPVPCVAAAIRLAREAGVRIILDPAPARPVPEGLLAIVDVLRGNADEIGSLSGVAIADRETARKAARALIERGAGAVVVAAAGGNLLVADNEELWVPEFEVRRVDSTGAGDAFAAALAVGLAEERPLQDAMRFAAAAAALTTTLLGGQAGLPRRPEVEAFLRAAQG